MWNLWTYISAPQSSSLTEVAEPPQLKLDYARVTELIDQIKSSEGVNMFAFPSTAMAQTFENVMGTLNGLLNVVVDLKHEHQQNLGKLSEYERAKKQLAQHTEMIKNMEEQNAHNLKQVYKEKSKQAEKFQKESTKLKKQLQQLSDELAETKANLKELRIANSDLQETLQEKDQVINSLQRQVEAKSAELTSILLLKKQEKGEPRTINTINLEVVFFYSKLRKNIYQFLDPIDFAMLGTVSRKMNTVTDETMKNQFFKIVLKNQKQKCDRAQNWFNDYKKIYDRFPAENIRTNAIKYLFFKIKPGGYLLPYFQEDNEAGQKTEKKKESRWGQLAIWKKKEDNESMLENNDKLSQLKNDAEFKILQKKIDSFFENLFQVQLPGDLNSFGQILERQQTELKLSLKEFEKSEQVLYLSRFLFLETNELFNLLQVCFSLLLNSVSQLKDFKKKYQDVIENDQSLRNLVDSIANDRSIVEKRVWFLENQNISGKNQISKMQALLQKLEQENSLMSGQLRELESDNKNLKGGFEKDRKEKKKLQIKLAEITELLASADLID